MGDVSATIATCGASIDVDPKHSWSYFRRGRALHKQARTGEALADLERAVILDPKQIEILVLRGNLREATGAREQAIADYRAALKIDPADDDDRAALKDALDRLTRLNN